MLHFLKTEIINVFCYILRAKAARML